MSELLYDLYASTLDTLRAAPFDLFTLEVVQREARLASEERGAALNLALSDYLARTPIKSAEHFGRLFRGGDERNGLVWDARGSNPEPTA